MTVDDLLLGISCCVVLGGGLLVFGGAEALVGVLGDVVVGKGGVVWCMRVKYG